MDVHQSWILPRLADFLDTHFPDEDGGVDTNQAAKALYETWAEQRAEHAPDATASVADGLRTGEEDEDEVLPGINRRQIQLRRERADATDAVSNLCRLLKRLLERAAAASEGESFGKFKRDGLEQILQMARIWVRGPAPSGSNRQYRSIADLTALIPKANEGDSELTAEQIQGQLAARLTEQDWIHDALETLVPSLARPETIEPLHPTELSIMVADEAPLSEPWAQPTVRRIPALRDSPAVLTMVRDRRAKWAEKGYPELAVIGVLCWALAPLCYTWHVMNKKDRTARVATLLKAADGHLADEAKARTQPELIPYFPPKPSPPLSAEEYERLSAEEERTLLPHEKERAALIVGAMGPTSTELLGSQTYVPQEEVEP